MSDSQSRIDQADALNVPKRRRFKGVLVLLVLIGVGSAAAFHFLKKPPKPRPVVEYEELDEAQAAAQVQKAKTQKELDQEALASAQAEMKTVQADWESALREREEAERKFAAASAEERDSLAEALAQAESQFTQASAKLGEAKARLKAAEDKLKTADQLLAEAKAERARVEKQIVQEAAHRKALLGHWKRSDYYGGLTLELRDDDTGLMVVDFNFATKLVVGTNRLEVDIRWKVANGDHVIFDSVRGRPEKAFHFVSKEKGNRRDQVLMHIEENTFTTHDADNKAKVKTWTRIKSG